MSLMISKFIHALDPECTMRVVLFDSNLIVEGVLATEEGSRSLMETIIFITAIDLCVSLCRCATSWQDSVASRN